MYGIIGSMLDDKKNEIDVELLEGFLEESYAVLADLKIILASFKGTSDAPIFEKYGQQIDRIMGAAYTLSLNELGDLAKLGKELGYKTSQIKQVAKLLTMQSLLSQLLRTMEKILNSYQKNQTPDYDEAHQLINRLNTASDQLGDLRISVKV